MQVARLSPWNMGACATKRSDKNEKEGSGEASSNDATSAWGAGASGKKEKKKRARKADRVVALKADTTSVETYSAEAQRAREAARPAGQLDTGRTGFAGSETGAARKESPGRAAPGFLATPSQSPAHVDASSAPIVSGGVERGAPAPEKQSGPSTGSSAAPTKPAELKFQKPSYELSDEVAPADDDIPCEVVDGSGDPQANQQNGGSAVASSARSASRTSSLLASLDKAPPPKRRTLAPLKPRG